MGDGVHFGKVGKEYQGTIAFVDNIFYLNCALNESRIGGNVEEKTGV